MIKYIKNDFKSVRAALSYGYGRNIPMWFMIPYYTIIGLLALPLIPLACIWRIGLKIKYRF